MTELASTPGQTIGPFFGYALPFERDHELVPTVHPKAVSLSGVVYDGVGAPIPDAMLEIRQTGPDGRVPTISGSMRRDRCGFTGWGRTAVNSAGEYAFHTLEPGCGRPGGAAFFSLVVFARGLLDRLFTRIYLPDDEVALAADPLLASLPAERRSTLIATRTLDGDLQFDIHLQGERETVFLQFPRQLR